MDITPKLLEIVREAGRRVLVSYSSGEVSTRLKEDHSPVTNVDIESHDFLCEALGSAFEFPIVSEELEVPFEERRGWNAFWLVDPLDGTKEFLAKTGEFTINVALVRDAVPIIGVVYAPALGEMYYAFQGQGAYMVGDDRRLPLRLNRPRVALASRFHHSPEAEELAKKYGVESMEKVGAALKFCRLARGDALLYPRFSGSKEWDTAAGQVLVEEAGGGVIDLRTKQSIVYNKPVMKNGSFIAVGDASILGNYDMLGEV